MSPAPRALLNGRATSESLAVSRGLHYGDGVFRTLLVADGAVHALDEQLERLARDAAALHLDMPPHATLAAELAQLAGGERRAVLKLILMRKPGARGYRADTDACDRLVLRYPAPAYPSTRWSQGARAWTHPLRLAVQPRLAGIKHLNRLEQVLASRDWPANVDEAILCDAEGRPVGGTRTNLFAVTGGSLVTPSLTRCGVEGVTRNKILGLARQLSVTTIIADDLRPVLDAADELFVCNAVIGIWPLRALDARELPAPGPLTRRLAQALAHPGPG